MMMRFILSLVLLLCVSASAAAQVPGNCGLQLGGPVVFCDTFDVKKDPSVPSRTGDLDPNVWGVSRIGGNLNVGGNALPQWNPTPLVGCTGTETVLPPNDIKVCNGQLREGLDDQKTILAITMYPKQPFDFAGRTGTVAFDVTNDTQGSHAAWPEFWLTDLPIPGPFTYYDECAFCSIPQNGFGITFDIDTWPGNSSFCPDGGDVHRNGVAGLRVVRNYVVELITPADPSRVQVFSCVKSSSGPNGLLNHYELRISQNQIEVWGSDAGTTSLRLMTRFMNVNLSLTRGLVWIADAHYNAEKGSCEITGEPCQSQHTFTWDNVAFDGPFTFRDFSFDALDDMTPRGDGSVNLGKVSQAGETSSWNVLNMPANPQAAAARVLFSFSDTNFARPQNFTVTVNGHPHPTPSPFGAVMNGNQGFWKPMAVTIPLTDLVPGTNVVQLGSPDQPIVTLNVNIVLSNVPGGVPVLPGSDNSYPASGPVPVNGVCGSANGVPVSTAPSTNLCMAGTASLVSGTGPWAWSCAGSGGGTTAMCSAPLLPPPPLPTASIAANPSTIDVGSSSMLTWSSTNATACTASGAWSGSQAISGSLAVSPPSTATYTLACSGEGGISPAASATVTVNPAPPPASVPITASSGNKLNAIAVATLPAAAGVVKTTYICGFSFTSSGSNNANVFFPTITGMIGGTMTFAYATVGNVNSSNQPLSLQFDPCIPAAAPNTAITVTLPALGAGNKGAAANAWGFQK